MCLAAAAGSEEVIESIGLVGAHAERLWAYVSDSKGTRRKWGRQKQSGAGMAGPAQRLRTDSAGQRKNLQPLTIELIVVWRCVMSSRIAMYMCTIEKIITIHMATLCQV